MTKIINKNGILLFVLLLICTFSAKAQVDAQYSQYNDILNYYNPAAIGLESQLTVQAIHRMQWAGVENAPQSFFFSVDTPIKLFKKQHGLGVNFFNESIGLFTNQAFYLQYSYKIKFLGGELSIGPQVGLFDQSFDASKIHIPSSEYHQASEDGMPTSDAQGMAFDMGIGGYYTHKYFYVGLSSTHIMESSVELDTKITSYLPRAYYFVAGSNISIKKTLIDLQPSLLLKSDLVKTQVDVSLRAWYNQRFSGTVTWRYGDAIVIMLGARIKNIQVGYAYDISTSAIAKVSSGSHEIMLKYCFDLKNNRNSKNKHKSVRIL